ncbi:hypothetical protein MG290_00605 [Flavobacterium sp. CBA20B-1]|uniref:hypothetical protein n=1 Tax=unclassified Flavobacterium TaxID=196869 RepID=UPI0022255C1F|nr:MULTISPECIES: hypothetical protein [unclassified Flavobacterium]WCM42203.1 hypothetical protein MG290_00605 [Flavobacterium sp. CBA20B-1]
MNEIVIKPDTITTDKQKYRLLFLGLLFDFIGTLSFTIPFLGEFTDVIWAPISAILLKTLYKGTIGTVGGMVSFVEEILPGLDFVPTFTLTWLYTYVFKKQ